LPPAESGVGVVLSADGRMMLSAFGDQGISFSAAA
jgi:hypothetical protein